MNEHDGENRGPGPAVIGAIAIVFAALKRAGPADFPELVWLKAAVGERLNELHVQAQVPRAGRGP